uniref:Asparagine synthetase domain-containing protein n=1 Tax=Biomphalaria glabrata TaxID=6526 RepID=A0A2C9LHF1_BIOGL
MEALKQLKLGSTTAALINLNRVEVLKQHCFISLQAQISNELKQSNGSKQKLKSAFSDCDLLPNEILWRPKEAFSDGISSVSRSWYQIIQDHCNEQINKNDLAQAATLYPHNTPKTSEALYYRRIFEKYYAHKSSWIPYFWMPKWSGDTTDPSARTLKHYKQ